MSPVRVVVLGLMAVAVVFGVAALRLGLYQDGLPGPGLLPLAASLLLLAGAGRLWRQAAELDSGERFQAGPIVTVLGFGLMVPLLKPAGFVLCTLVFVAAYARLLHHRPWGSAIALSLGLTAGAVLLFAYLLAVPLPLWPAVR